MPPLLNITARVFPFLATYCFFPPTGSEKSGSSLLCSVTHLMLSIILYMALSQQPVCLCHRAAAKEDRLSSSSCCQGEIKFVFIMLGWVLVTKVAYAIQHVCFWRWPLIHRDNKWINKYHKIPHRLFRLRDPQKKTCVLYSFSVNKP